jgi:hypothetical protein
LPWGHGDYGTSPNRSRCSKSWPSACVTSFRPSQHWIRRQGNVALIRSPLATLAVFLDRLGRLEPAATIAGFAFSPFTASAVPELTTAITHLRDVLGEAAYESLACRGETMTTAAMATYAYDQIDQARAELNAVLK